MLNTIQNEDETTLEDLKINPEENLFIFAVGYEERSIALFDNYFNLPGIHKICFLFDDFEKHPSSRLNKELIDKESVVPIEANYKNSDLVIQTILEKLSLLKNNHDCLNIHIDYSSMPRSWYCKIPDRLGTVLRPSDRVYFWYSEGKYPNKAESWPSAGIQDVEVFNGKPSTNPLNKRSHIFGLGFDKLRSQAIYSVLDPSLLVVTYSFPTDYKKMGEVINKTNKDIISSAAFSSVLPIDDFLFSISKLYETVKELHFDGDVILVPDGPKPQILIYSLMPMLFRSDGVICLHVKRHAHFYKPLNVKARGRIFGFSYTLDN